MSQTASRSLETAYQVVDAVTRLKGVTGALIVDGDGLTIAEDFRSDEDLQRAASIGTTLPFDLVKNTNRIRLGAVKDLTLQTRRGGLRAYQHDGIWLLVFLGPNTNLGMLNIEMRQVYDQFASIYGERVSRDVESEKQHIIEVIQSTGSVRSIVEKRRNDLKGMRSLHEMLFRVAIEKGIPRDNISRVINDINYRVYRESLIDIGFDFFNRKALDSYDPALALKLMEEQINGIAGLIVAGPGE